MYLCCSCPAVLTSRELFPGVWFHFLLLSWIPPVSASREPAYHFTRQQTVMPAPV